jgi:putative flippase GtrA
MMDLIKKHAEKIRFAIVGGANTALDFIILFILVAFGIGQIPANYLSTSASLVFSFFVNKSFTFKSKSGNAKKQFILFIIITLIGLWILQPLVIAGTSHVLQPYEWSEEIVLLIAKLAATVVSLTWNYILYTRLVFKKAV